MGLQCQRLPHETRVIKERTSIHVIDLNNMATSSVLILYEVVGCHSTVLYFNSNRSGDILI